MDRRALGVGGERDAQPERRPARRLRREIGERAGGLVAVALERVDAQIERRAARERRALLRPLVAEHAGEMRIEPFRIVAGDMRRRARRGSRVEPRPLGVGQRRAANGARRRRAGRSRRHRACARAAACRARTARGAVVAHHIGARRAPAQRVVDQAGDRRTVAGAGEAVREPPILERIGGRPPPRLDLGEDLDGGGKTGAGRHQRPSRMRDMKIAHINASTTAPTANTAAAHAHIVAGHVDIGMHQAQCDEQPGQRHEQVIGVPRDDHQDGQHIEQHRQLELVAEALANWVCLLRPVRLAQAPRRADAPRRAAPPRRGRPPSKTATRR